MSERDEQNLCVSKIEARQANAIVVAEHYLHRKAPISFAFGLFDHGDCVGVVTYGCPASRHMLLSACKQNPERVLELNRLWVDDRMPRNTESWFVARSLAMLPPRIILSYADTAVGHFGYIYRALNFYYAGWTDMDRRTPRFDYVVIGKHSRAAFRGVAPIFTERKRRLPKMKYWTTTGDRRQRRKLALSCLWLRLDWGVTFPATTTKALP